MARDDLQKLEGNILNILVISKCFIEQNSLEIFLKVLEHILWFECLIFNTEREILVVTEKTDAHNSRIVIK